jgi:hypothetical protein
MTKKELFIFYFLSFTWGIVWTLIGLLVLAFVYVFMYEHVIIKKVSGRIAIIFREKTFGGISLGIVYMVDAYNRIETHKHEIGHTVQNIVYGPLFIPLVAIPSGIRYQLWPMIRQRTFDRTGKYPSYHSIWFEKQANEWGEKFDIVVRQDLGKII